MSTIERTITGYFGYPKEVRKSKKQKWVTDVNKQIDK